MNWREAPKRQRYSTQNARAKRQTKRNDLCSSSAEAQRRARRSSRAGAVVAQKSGADTGGRPCPPRPTHIASHLAQTGRCLSIPAHLQARPPRALCASACGVPTGGNSARALPGKRALLAWHGLPRSHHTQPADHISTHPQITSVPASTNTQGDVAGGEGHGCPCKRRRLRGSLGAPRPQSPCH